MQEVNRSGVPHPPLPNELKEHEFKIKEKVLSVGHKYSIENSRGQLVGFCKQKILKMKEDIRIFKSKDMQEELFRIKQENILDFSGTFRIVDSKTDSTIGYLGRKGVKSLVKDEWIIMDSNKNQIGLAKEDSLLKAIIRRYILSILPYNYKLFLGGQKVGNYKEKFTLMKDIYNLDLSGDANFNLDRRLILSLAICLDAIEGE